MRRPLKLLHHFALLIALILPGLILCAAARAEEEKMSDYKMPPLSQEEDYVIRQQGTERPFSGRFWKHAEDGSYLCRQCGAKLFASGQKFDSECGWPSFDEAISGAVEERPDRDGRRTEIVCAVCKGHLGHVFRGEKLTDKNTRFCVNSLSLAFEPKDPDISRLFETAVFAGGCFWGVEDFFGRLPGVISAVSGYTGGSLENPSYEEVSTGSTGHAEAVEITYDSARISYEDLARLFFEIHDPTQLNRQGPDRGTQYRSAVYPRDEKEKAVINKLIGQLKASGFKVVTSIEDPAPFYPAEDYHQDYIKKTGRPSCHIRVKRFEK